MNSGRLLRTSVGALALLGGACASEEGGIPASDVALGTGTATNTGSQATGAMTNSGGSTTAALNPGVTTAAGATSVPTSSGTAGATTVLNPGGSGGSATLGTTDMTGLGTAGTGETGGATAIGGMGGAATAGMSGASATGGMGGVATAGMSGAAATGGMSGAAAMSGGGAAAGGMTSGSPGMSSGCGTEPTIPSNMYNNGERISITAAGMERRYILRVPDNYDNTKPYKLIIAWHQRDGNDVQMYANDYYHLLPLSNDSAIFVAPNGQKNGSPCTTTNNGDGSCGWPNPNGSDIALADAVVDELEANFCIDTNRIFATGWSYGGSMSYKHACERGLGGTKDGVQGYIRGIAVYSGAQLSGQCTPSTPVAYYGSHGTSDGVLGYENGVGLAQNFATANGCNWATPTEVTSGNHVCTDIMGCDDGYPTKFCSFNGDHTPDPRDGNQQSWQYQLVWDFFDQF